MNNSNKEIETQKYKKMEKRGKLLFEIGMSGVIVTVLSPFDFEGPIAEILTAIIAIIGFVMKTIAKNKLSNNDDEVLDKQELNQTADKVADAIKKTKHKNKRLNN